MRAHARHHRRGHAAQHLGRVPRALVDAQLDVVLAQEERVAAEGGDGALGGDVRVRVERLLKSRATWRPDRAPRSSGEERKGPVAEARAARLWASAPRTRAASSAGVRSAMVRRWRGEAAVVGVV